MASIDVKLLFTHMNDNNGSVANWSNDEYSVCSHLWLTKKLQELRDTIDDFEKLGAEHIAKESDGS